MKHNIMDDVVNNGFCIGCGVCVAICPDHCLTMTWNQKGSIEPTFTKECKNTCGLCLKSCPFYEQKIEKKEIAEELFNAHDIEFSNDAGFYSTCWAGYSLVDADRGNGASGGMATWFIRHCLDNGIVDFAAVVGPTIRDNPLFDFQLVSKTKELEKTRGSKYYPVSVHEVLTFICEQEEKKYLIIGLPCLLYGIRLAARHNAKMRRRIKILAGLTCGGCPTKMMCDCLSKAQGKTPQAQDEISFRKKKNNAQTAYDYEFFIKNGGYPILGKSMYGLYGFLWTNHFFRHRSCFFCDDVFAEVADIVFMDAWLSRFTRDPGGNNLIIVRNMALNVIFEPDIIRGKCFLEPVDIHDICKSQELLIQWKKIDIDFRYQLAAQKGNQLPLRTPVADVSIDDIQVKAINRNRHFISVAAWSNAIWPRYRRWGRAGVVFFIAHCMIAHFRTVRYFENVAYIFPFLNMIRLMKRIARRLLRLTLPGARFGKTMNSRDNG
jgi:coenzyme F420 hydrogenase subunit beta